MPFAFDNLDWADGSNNDGGIGQYIYYSPLSNITTFPAVPATPTTNADVVTVSDPFVMVATKTFKKIYCTRDQGEVVSKMIGETDSKSYENTAEFFIPGNQAEVLAFLEMIKNTNGVFIVPDREDQMRIIGSKNLPAKIEVGETTTGKKAGDMRGTKITVKSVGRIAPIYDNTVPLT